MDNPTPPTSPNEVKNESKEPLPETEELASGLEQFTKHKDAAAPTIKLLLRPVSGKVTSPQATGEPSLTINTSAKSDKASDSAQSKQSIPSIIFSAISQTGCLVTIILFIAAILAFRFFGWTPFLFKEIPSSPPNNSLANSEFNHNFVLIATFLRQVVENNQKVERRILLFYDQYNETISEVSLDATTGELKARSSAKPNSIPSVDKIILSPKGDKASVLATRIKGRTGLFVLDFSLTAENDGFVQKWSGGLPDNYVIHSQSSASWSPDNTTIAFAASKEGASDLFIATSEKQIQRITYHGKNIGTVAWLDDQRLVFVSDWEGKDQMYVIKRDGGSQKILDK